MILGIQIGETGGAALYDKGKILYAASEERFSRIKNDLCYPHKTIMNIVEKYDIKPTDIEAVTVATVGGSAEKFLVNPASFSISDWVREQREYWYPMFYGGNKTPVYTEVFRDKCEQSQYDDLYTMIKEKKIVMGKYIENG